MPEYWSQKNITEASIARQRLVKDASAARNTHAAAEKLLGALVSNQFELKLCKESPL
jgi:hypothetical protein